MAPGVPVNWEIMLVAAVAGVALGIGVLAALYLPPLLRVGLAADGEVRARVLETELDYLRRLGDAAAVLEEHGRSSQARELREEADFQALLLALGEAWAVRRENPF